jgi:putative heme-binding domain-containing protein
MVRLTSTRVFLILLFSAPLPASAQTGNPYETDPRAIRAGGALFGARCAQCHGGDAKGITGPDLTLLWASGASDDRVFQTIQTGVLGSIMPSSAAPDLEIWAMVAYVKSISTVPEFDNDRGDARRGEEIFSTTCTRCHSVNGAGGRLGPDLSRIATIRSRDMLIRSIRDPSASMAVGYRPVTVVTRDGERVRAVTKGEDAFSIQILDTRGRLQGYVKADVQEVIREERSLMPQFGPDRLSDEELDDLLQYLGTLRGADSDRL